ncbi:proteasome subunit alpha [Mycobacterium kansasii]|uniref:proteasome subunit alpha n=1 Tax=Mycobacterium kansasii TaxID=1768 RepID=UPI000CDD5F42|nr:proteasome subunit alpha [Mycobacterium kansasii]POY31534.1 proteasome subunit alpha [Mycobacterium kansasii]
MSFPYFISPEQAMRERSELARKGIARGKSVVALAHSGGVLFVAENPSRSLQKISELYDRVGFAAAGKFNEFDNLRRGGIQFADTRGYAYDRRDVTGRQLANVYAQTLGTIFTEQAKPYEVELCVAEVAHYGETKPPELYRITYDGSIADEPHFVVMGGTTEPIATALKESYAENADLPDALRIAVEALRASSADTSGNGQPALGVANLEVAILDANRPRRAFRRITGAHLETLLQKATSGEAADSEESEEPKDSDKPEDSKADGESSE